MDLDDIAPDVTIDAKGLTCPMPLLKAKQAMEKLASGQVLAVLGTDPGSQVDLPGWCKYAGHTFLGSREEAAGSYIYYLKKG
ncbi:MAG: preprotein translocase subunit TatC [Deltaproteobacteria bacterium RIFOXYD12_FULL_57_12]|nr:MAG: preprotein translocase subunit TatC [Deltaproteobacteria bacterium RIFOXYD12_FULL_57_12]